MRQLSYFPQYEGDPESMWFPDNDSEKEKIKLLQTLVGVYSDGDMTNVTRNQVRTKLPKYASASTKGILENIDTIIAELQALNVDKENGKTEPWYSKYRYHIGGGILGLGVLAIVVRRMRKGQ